MTARPLVAITLATAAGILAAQFCPFAAGLAAVALVLCALLVRLTRRAFWRDSALLVAFFLIGFARWRSVAVVPADDVSRYAPAVVTLRGTVQSDVDVLLDAQTSRIALARFTLATDSVSVPPDLEARNVSGSVRIQLLMKPGASDATENTASEIPLPAYGDLITVHGLLKRPEGMRNPGGFDYAASLARSGTYSTLSPDIPSDWRIERHTFANPLAASAFATRAHFLSSHAGLSRIRNGVLNAILLGDRSAVPAELRNAFERTSTIHILATAGVHVGILTGLLLWTLRLVRVSRRSARLVTAFVLVLYMLMAGGRPAVVRAGLVALVFLLGLVLEREPSIPNALSVAALALILTNPRSLLDPGFLLSFATVITILALLPFAEPIRNLIRSRLAGEGAGRRLTRFLSEFCAGSVILAAAAQLGAAPLVAYYFNDLSLIGVFANALIAPALPLVLSLGFLSGCLGAVSPVLAAPLDSVLNLLLGYIVGVVDTCSKLPGANIAVASPSPWLLVYYYAALWGGAWKLRERMASKAHYRSSSGDR